MLKIGDILINDEGDIQRIVAITHQTGNSDKGLKFWHDSEKLGYKFARGKPGIAYRLTTQGYIDKITDNGHTQ